MNNKENGVGSETVIQAPMAAQIVPAKAAGNQASSTSRVLWIGAYVVLMVLIGLRLPWSVDTSLPGYLRR
jgi:hypothetical protein